MDTNKDNFTKILSIKEIIDEIIDYRLLHAFLNINRWRFRAAFEKVI